jgi:peptide/nickel transport system substrate-binding protein
MVIDRRMFLRFLGAATVSAAWPVGKKARAAAAEDQDRVLVVATNFSLPSLDPGRQFHTTSQLIDHATYDALVTFEGEDLKHPKPALALRWTVSSDGKTYTFTLRPNVRFASGNPLTSRDVKWSLERVSRLEASPAFFLDGVVEVLAPNSETVVIKLAEPKPGLVATLSSPSLSILDSTLVIEHGGDAGLDAANTDRAEAYLNSHSAGSGAFVLAGYIPDQEVTLVKNPSHWRGTPALDRVVVRNVPEAGTHQLMLQRGDIDVTTGIRQDQVHALRQVNGVAVKTSEIALIFHLTMNQRPETGGPFSNPKVQQAVRYALDYDGIMKIAGPGAVRVAGVVPPNFPEALDAGEAARTDRARARALLRDAAAGDFRGRFVYSTDRIVSGIQASVLAQKIQQDLADVGITLEMNGLPHATALPLIAAGRAAISIGTWRADYPDASDFLPAFLPGGAVAKMAGWSGEADPAGRALAELGGRAAIQTDSRKRVELYREAQRRLADIGPYVPLFAPASPYAYRSNVQGVTFNSVWGLDFFAIHKMS